MSLIASLGLVPPKSLTKAAPPAPPKPSAGAKAADAALLASMSEFARTLADAAAEAKTPDQTAAVEAAKKQLASLVKGAEEARQAARKLGDEHDKERMLEAAKAKLEEHGKAVLKKNLPRVLAGLEAVAKANEEPPKPEKAVDGEVKMDDTAIVGLNQMGFASGGQGSLEAKQKSSGASVKVDGKFGVKCWVDVTEVPLRKEVYEVAFHAVFELEASLAAKLKQGSGLELSRGKELAIKIKHEIQGAAKKDTYVGCVSAGKAGAFPELKLAAALDQANFDDLKALIGAVQSLGGQVGGLQAMADGDEQEIENKDTTGYGAGFTGKAGIEAGVKKMGSVTRTVKRSGKKWEFEYIDVKQETQSAGVSGQSGAGVGMGIKGAASVQIFTRVVFEVPEDHPKLQERLQQVADADSLDKLKALRASCKDLKFSFTEGRSEGGSKQIDWMAGPVGMSLQDGESRGHSETEDSEGNRVVTDSGSNERGGTMNALGDALFGDKKKQDFHGAADQNNVGMGEVGDSTESFGLLDTLKDKGAKALKEVTGVDVGSKGPATEEHLKSIELSNADYGKLAELAKRAGDWDHAGLYGNNAKTYTLWQGLRKRVAGGKRAEINAALADFEKSAGNGLRDIVRAALGYSDGKALAVESEFPAGLAGYKDLYMGFVRFDPMEPIREAGDAKRMRKKWEATCEQMQTLVDKIHENSKAFHDTGLAMRMAQRVQAALKKVQKEGGKLLAEAEKDQSTLPPSAEDEELALRAEYQAELEEKIRHLKRDIDSMHTVEQNDFKAWEEELDSFHFVKATEKYLAWRNKLMKAHSDWRGLILELRKALEEAGPPYNPAEANAVRPDDDRLKRLVRNSRL
jgi:hypothetical protein